MIQAAKEPSGGGGRQGTPLKQRSTIKDSGTVYFSLPYTTTHNMGPTRTLGQGVSDEALSQDAFGHKSIGVVVGSGPQEANARNRCCIYIAASG